MPADLDHLLTRVEHVLDKLEHLLPSDTPTVSDWTAQAYLWKRNRAAYMLQAIEYPHTLLLESLLGIEEQKQKIITNTKQFLQELPANHVLLTGARGTGKSSVIKALLPAFAAQGLRLIEVSKQDLSDLPDIANLLRQRPERFVLYCDDLSFEQHDPSYKALKVALDGSLTGKSNNLLIYATSNRRHLMPEAMHDNLDTRRVGDEVHPGDTLEEKMSLSERFGLWLHFYPFQQETYLAIVCYWLTQFGYLSFPDHVRQAALQFAITRGSRSGRVAWQFACDWAGQQALNSQTSQE